MKSQYKKNKPIYYFNSVGDRTSFTLEGIYSHKYRWMRRPKTSQELRMFDKEYSRAKRKNIPTAYADQSLSFNYAKCWKRFTKRKHQYKGC